VKYRQIGFFAAAMAFIGMTASIIGTKRNIPYLHQTSVAQQSRPWFHAFTELFKVLHLLSARAFLLANLVIAVGIGMALTMVLHINTLFYGFSSEQMGIYMLSIFLALAPASWFAMKGTRLLSKPKSIIRFGSILTLFGPIPVLGHLYGLTPPSASYALLTIMCIFVVLQQSFYISYLTVIGAMVPDIADEIELTTEFRKEGILNSAMMLTGKVTFGLGTFLAGLTIDFAGFDGVTTVEQITQSMLTRLGWFYSLTITSLFLIDIYLFSHYRLDETRYKEIPTSIDEKKRYSSNAKL
jgi:GPH family glycoside/pentoside/hexuronide:cation symporter